MSGRLIEYALITVLAGALAIFVGVSAASYVNHAFAKVERSLEQTK